MESWDDAWLTEAIRSALENEPGLGGAYVTAEACGGVVTLRGVVRSPAQPARVASLARNFGGVRDLRNDVEIGP